MKVKIKHLGFNPSTNKHTYFIVTANGHTDYIYEKPFIKSGEIELDDDLWTEGSGWADIDCPVCGTYYRERTRAGRTEHCPICDSPYVVTENDELEADNFL